MNLGCMNGEGAEGAPLDINHADFVYARGSFTLIL